MPLFEVKLSRAVQESCSVLIEAPTREAAWTAAHHAADDLAPDWAFRVDYVDDVEVDEIGPAPASEADGAVLTADATGRHWTWADGRDGPDEVPT